MRPPVFSSHFPADVKFRGQQLTNGLVEKKLYFSVGTSGMTGPIKVEAAMSSIILIFVFSSKNPFFFLQQHQPE